MPVLKPLIALGVTLALGACAAAPPAGPAVLALPPEGKDLARFQQEDGSCRRHAAAQTGDARAAPPVRGCSSATTWPTRSAWRPAATGRVQQALPAAPYYPPYPYRPYGAYPAYYSYPAYYGPWFGPAVSVGVFGGFGPHHHRGSFHHGGGFHRR